MRGHRTAQFPLYDQGMRELGSFADLQQDPHPEYLAVLADLVLSGSHPQIMEHFNSGIRCAVHAVDLIASSGWRLELVVKRFATEFIQEDPGAFERERRVLEILPRSEVLAPRLVWADEGEIFGVPTIVMTRLPGTPLMRVQARQPSTDSSWVRPVVRMLARIHRTPITAEDLDFLPVLDSGTVSREMLAISEDDIERRVALLPWGAEVWTTLQQYWSHAPPEDLVLVHGDFHAGNLLWHRDNIAGVIDWAGAKLGSPEYDLTHLRWETILRYDSEVVDMVRHAYEEEAGRPMPDSAIWDLTLVWRLGDAIRSWIWFFQIEGREATTLEELQERRRFLIGRALERIR
jgi:aminoglycoside phosphotransferase (APT) family kinase protein